MNVKSDLFMTDAEPGTPVFKFTAKLAIANGYNRIASSVYGTPIYAITSVEGTTAPIPLKEVPSGNTVPDIQYRLEVELEALKKEQKRLVSAYTSKKLADEAIARIQVIFDKALFTAGDVDGNENNETPPVEELEQTLAAMAKDMGKVVDENAICDECVLETKLELLKQRSKELVSAFRKAKKKQDDSAPELDADAEPDAFEAIEAAVVAAVKANTSSDFTKTAAVKDLAHSLEAVARAYHIISNIKD